MSESISFKYTLTEDDFVRAVRASARSKRLWWIMWAVRLGALAAIYFLLSGIAGVAGYYSIVIILTLFTITGASYWWRFSFYPRRIARNSPFLNVEIEATASNEGMKWDSTLAKGESRWAAYTDALETADHFLLFGAKNLFYVYPKRGFSAPEAVDSLRELIRKNLPNARVLR